MPREKPDDARSFDIDETSVVAVRGSPDKLAFHDPTTPESYLAMEAPLSLRDYR